MSKEKTVSSITEIKMVNVKKKLMFNRQSQKNQLLISIQKKWHRVSIKLYKSQEIKILRRSERVVKLPVKAASLAHKQEIQDGIFLAESD